MRKQRNTARPSYKNLPRSRVLPRREDAWFSNLTSVSTRVNGPIKPRQISGSKSPADPAASAQEEDRARAPAPRSIKKAKKWRGKRGAVLAGPGKRERLCGPLDLNGSICRAQRQQRGGTRFPGLLVFARLIEFEMCGDSGLKKYWDTPIYILYRVGDSRRWRKQEWAFNLGFRPGLPGWSFHQYFECGQRRNLYYAVVLCYIFINL